MARKPGEHVADEAALIKDVIGLVDAACAGGEIERGRYGAHAMDKRRGRFAQFAGQFQRYVAAERESHQVCRRVELPQEGQKVAQ